MKPTIGFDIDGVLADFTNHYLSYLQFEDTSLPSSWTDERFVKHFHKISDDIDFWLSIPPLVSVEDIHIQPDVYITARSVDSSVTKQWLDAHGFHSAPVITVGHNGNKVESCHKAGVDMFIDDASHNFKELNDANILCLLHDASHNQEIATEKRIISINEASRWL